MHHFLAPGRPLDWTFGRPSLVFEMTVSQPITARRSLLQLLWREPRFTLASETQARCVLHKCVLDTRKWAYRQLRAIRVCLQRCWTSQVRLGGYAIPLV